MKALKVFVVMVMLAAFSFSVANAQVHHKKWHHKRHWHRKHRPRRP